MEMDVMHSIQQVNEIHLAIHLVTLTDGQTKQTGWHQLNACLWCRRGHSKLTFKRK